MQSVGKMQWPIRPQLFAYTDVSPTGSTVLIAIVLLVVPKWFQWTYATVFPVAKSVLQFDRKNGKKSWPNFFRWLEYFFSKWSVIARMKCLTLLRASFRCFTLVFVRTGRCYRLVKISHAQDFVCRENVGMVCAFRIGLWSWPRKPFVLRISNSFIS